MSGVNEIRRTFLDYFARHGHAVVASSPLVPRNDPTLMFANSGMVQFKNVFTGAEKRDYVRATTAQKCVRAGGKHNDLDNVGYTARHHTFFEMLGNFSFGDYFKAEAIERAWELITKVYGLPADRLGVTVYHTDDEAFDLWRKIAGLPEARILRVPTSDNFWAMGDTGPCGPCSEIFFDHGVGEGKWALDAEGRDLFGERYVEIWNLVFMQYEQRVAGGTLDDGGRVPLPKPSIDTGMGIERIAAVLQGVHDNYDIDLFRALIAKIKEESEKIGAVTKGQTAEKAPYKVIADHLRATSFLIADGVLPSNEGRGYVLRRIMRRAMRYAHQLGCKEPLMYRLVGSLVAEMGEAYPELVRARSLVTETLKLEENRFKRTLEKGLSLLEAESDELGVGDTLSGEVAFKLYDTYGFPLDLTQDALRRRGIEVDTDGFSAAMARQKAEARKSWAGSGEAATEGHWLELRERLGATEFLGYDTERAEGQIRAIVRDGKELKQLKKGDEAAIVVNQTPFYGESGGQVGDRGVIRTATGAVFHVTDTQKKAGDLFVHFGTVEKGPFRPGEAVELEVDHARRSATRANHSGTHLLHEALRQVLGEHVAQKGSLVAPDRLRFDFSHPKPISAEELANIERLANAMILQNSEVETRLMDIESAMATGAMALFGEKYGDEVRVVSMGHAEEGAKAGRAYSVELCGGTHVRRTGDIGLLRVLAESAVAAGVRRIEALTGTAARDYLATQDGRVRAAADILRARPEEVVERIAALLDERKRLERQLSDAKRQIALGGGGATGPASATGEAAIRSVGDVKLFARVLRGVDPKDLRGIVDEAKAQVGSGIAVVVGVSDEGKAGIVVGVTADLTGRFSAVDLVRVGAEALGGKGGGGRPDLAQAGGPDGTKAEAALAAVEHRIAPAA
ncbi:MAG: alanine--tRNA ligase [Rhizobiales bacterium]|nr:alanine--tRNA ligase [Hyphomicrobiales bacterium]